MNPEGSEGIAGKARQVLAKITPGATQARRSLPIRGSAADIQARWEEPVLREAILQGIPVAEAELVVGEEDRDWGRTTTLTLELKQAMPELATHVLAGKALRRLKSLTETGEIQNTDFNPSARADAGEPTL
jgi:hypothetical protein